MTAPAAAAALGPCQLCKRTDGELREVWLEVGRIQLGIRAQLCPVCYQTAPDRIRDELRGPMMRSILAVAGARLGILAPRGTPPPPPAPGPPAGK